MSTSSIRTDSVIDEVLPVLAAALGHWTGCDWHTQFGQNRLDLQGMRSSQAILMERATAGSEAADWRDAVAWLRRVEQDARQAESEARTAASLVRNGKLRLAACCANRACALEARYREPHTWHPLLYAIEAAMAKVDGNSLGNN